MLLMVIFISFNMSIMMIFENAFLFQDESFLKKNRIQLVVTVTPATECSTPPFHLLVEHKRFDLLDDGIIYIFTIGSFLKKLKSFFYFAKI